MRGTFHLTLGALALAALTVSGCQASGSTLGPLHQTTTGPATGLPQSQPLIPPGTDLPGGNAAQPIIPNPRLGPSVTDSSSFLDAGTLIGAGGAGTAGMETGTAAADAGSSLGPETGTGGAGGTGFGLPGAPDAGSLLGTGGAGMTGAGAGFGADGGVF